MVTITLWSRLRLHYGHDYTSITLLPLCHDDYIMVTITITASTTMITATITTTWSEPLHHYGHDYCHGYDYGFDHDDYIIAIAM